MNENHPGKTVSIAVGADHAGYALKTQLVDALKDEGYSMHDFGTFSAESVDYPDIGRKVAEAVASGKHDRGILICGTGIGMTIAANKINGIRAAACSEPYSAKMARAHNDANVIGIGGRVVGLGVALDIVIAFIETAFESGPRHQRRVDKIIAMEERGEETVAGG